MVDQHILRGTKNPADFLQPPDRFGRATNCRSKEGDIPTALAETPTHSQGIIADGVAIGQGR
jgi:hypothetical protein